MVENGVQNNNKWRYKCSSVILFHDRDAAVLMGDLRIKILDICILMIFIFHCSKCVFMCLADAAAQQCIEPGKWLLGPSSHLCWPLRCRPWCTLSFRICLLNQDPVSSRTMSTGLCYRSESTPSTSDTPLPSPKNALIQARNDHWPSRQQGWSSGMGSTGIYTPSFICHQRSHHTHTQRQILHTVLPTK